MKIIAAYNRISEAMAREMTAGALRDSPAHIAIANAGVAGTDGVDGIAVGTVCFAAGYGHRAVRADSALSRRTRGGTTRRGTPQSS